ncbi:CLUMA_CG020245, isoform A [Clunio marinus]|uniref:CLUMA_CG020245, isoform A n=1 Tax=Clunio marinus TaxID=568069 RepID=A0A1J1J5M4_9DIPT|nr:CLUMA_CG020245, isoform A [Clunio marinus]
MANMKEFLKSFECILKSWTHNDDEESQINHGIEINLIFNWERKRMLIHLDLFQDTDANERICTEQLKIPARGSKSQFIEDMNETLREHTLINFRFGISFIEEKFPNKPYFRAHGCDNLSEKVMDLYHKKHAELFDVKFVHKGCKVVMYFFTRTDEEESFVMSCGSFNYHATKRIEDYLECPITMGSFADFKICCIGEIDDESFRMTEECVGQALEILNGHLRFLEEQKEEFGIITKKTNEEIEKEFYETDFNIEKKQDAEKSKETNPSNTLCERNLSQSSVVYVDLTDEKVEDTEMAVASSMAWEEYVFFCHTSDLESAPICKHRHKDSISSFIHDLRRYKQIQEKDEENTIYESLSEKEKNIMKALSESLQLNNYVVFRRNVMQMNNLKQVKAFIKLLKEKGKTLHQKKRENKKLQKEQRKSKMLHQVKRKQLSPSKGMRAFDTMVQKMKQHHIDDEVNIVDEIPPENDPNIVRLRRLYNPEPPQEPHPKSNKKSNKTKSRSKNKN